MPPSLLYCPACGAANSPNQSVCFACAQPFTPDSAKHEQTSLLHDRYRMLNRVGTGGYGAVYKALDTQDQNRPVAIKQINLRGLSPQEMIEATDGFNREVRLLSTLSHSHLPRMHAHFTDTSHWYIVMDFIEGETLEYYLRDITSAQETAIRALVLDEVLDIGLQLCSVLTYLHAHQPPIIFRDLKPSNIMRTPQGQLYLIDFGIARYFTPGQTRDTIPLGSPGYAAPEQYGRAQTTQRADIYSLGAVLHHLLSLHDPSETPFTFSSLPVSGSTSLNELNTLIQRMVEQDVEKRPEEISEIESTLLHIRSQQSAVPRVWRPVSADQIPPAPVPARGAYQPVQVRQQIAQKKAQTRKTRRKFLAGGLALVSAIALGSTGYWRYWHPAGFALESGFPNQIPTPKSDVSTIAWSPDGQYLAFGLSDGSIVGKHLRNTPDFSITSAFAFNANASAQPLDLLAWSPDNKWLAAVSQPGQIQLWNVSLQRSQTLSISIKSQTLSVSAGNIQAIAWAPDSQHFAVGDDRGWVYMCNTQMAVNPLFNNQTASASPALTWSPDGTLLVCEFVMPAGPNSNQTTNTFQIWDVGRNQQLNTSFSLTTLVAKVLVWSPDGQYIASLGIDSILTVWDTYNENNQVFSQQIAAQQNQLAWSPDSHFLATIDDAYNLLLLNRSSGSTLVSIPISDPLGRGSVFPGQALTWLDSQHIAVASNNLECWLWSLSRF